MAPLAFCTVILASGVNNIASRSGVVLCVGSSCDVVDGLLSWYCFVCVLALAFVGDVAISFVVMQMLVATVYCVMRA